MRTSQDPSGCDWSTCRWAVCTRCITELGGPQATVWCPNHQPPRRLAYLQWPLPVWVQHRGADVGISIVETRDSLSQVLVYTRNLRSVFTNICRAFWRTGIKTKAIV